MILYIKSNMIRNCVESWVFLFDLVYVYFWNCRFRVKEFRSCQRSIGSPEKPEGFHNSFTFDDHFPSWFYNVTPNNRS